MVVVDDLEPGKPEGWPYPAHRPAGSSVFSFWTVPVIDPELALDRGHDSFLEASVISDSLNEFSFHIDLTTIIERVG